MTGKDDDAIFLAGEFGDDVVDGELTDIRIGGEHVVFDLIPREVGANVFFHLFVAAAV